MNFLNEMAVYAKVVELRSFSEAARRLGVTSSAVSRSIGRLEAHLGGRLLHRTTRSVTPTELGHELYGRCALIADTARDVLVIATHHASAPVGRLRVAAPVALGEQWLGPRLPAFLSLCPEVGVDLALSDTEPDLVDQGIDVALRLATALPPGVVARALRRSAYLLVAAPAYLQRRGRPQRPADLARHACILPTPHDLAGGLCLSDGQDQARVQVQGPLVVDNGAAILGAVEAGIGVGVLSDFSAAAALRMGRVVPLLPDWALLGRYRERKVYAVYAPTRHLPRKVRAFIDHLAATA